MRLENMKVRLREIKKMKRSKICLHRSPRKRDYNEKEKQYSEKKIAKNFGIDKRHDSADLRNTVILKQGT